LYAARYGIYSLTLSELKTVLLNSAAKKTTPNAPTTKEEGEI